MASDSSDPARTRRSAADSDPLLEWRARFPIAESTTYLISNSLGAMPRQARDSVGDYLRLWETRGVRAWSEAWWNLQFEVAADIETILGVAPSTVSMHQNVAAATEAIVSCFDFSGPRKKIVFSDLHFPSVMYLLEAQRVRGAEIVRVPAAEDGIRVDLQRLMDAIDGSTSLVCVSHVLFQSGFLQDARAIAARAREVGAFVVLDVYQSVGAVPLELAEWGVHAAVGGALKYLCGGPGNAFLYVAPGHIKTLQPTFTGWVAHAEPFAFRTDGQRLRDDGGRFLNGTPNVPALYSGRPGIAVVAEIGVQAIRAKSERITTAMLERCDHRGIEVRSPRDVRQRGNHLTLAVPHGRAVCDLLCAEDVVCDYRPGAGIRLSPHFYTTAREALDAVDRIAEVVDSGEYKRFAAPV